MQKVTITKGQFKGEQGTIMRHEGGKYFVIGHPSGHTMLRRDFFRIKRKN